MRAETGPGTLEPGTFLHGRAQALILIAHPSACAFKCIHQIALLGQCKVTLGG